MLGKKERSFAPLINVSLEDLVPPDHFYRHLERALDLSFVRELVQDTYTSKGRPSIDPVVFFKLQLVMFFEGLRSERQLMRHAADRPSVLWYLGYDLGEPLPTNEPLKRRSVLVDQGFQRSQRLSPVFIPRVAQQFAFLAHPRR